MIFFFKEPSLINLVKEVVQENCNEEKKKLLICELKNVYLLPSNDDYEKLM